MGFAVLLSSLALMASSPSTVVLAQADAPPVSNRSATQDRQDAVVGLLREQPVDLMLVIGGYNSSNTCNLARICAELSLIHI